MRLFVFGIGGTGGRLMEALTFLLAAGVRLLDSTGQPVELIPILIDTDKDNKDTLDGLSALKLYSDLHAMRDPADKDGFFSTKMEPLCSLATETNTEVSRTFRLNYKGVENQTFREFIGFNQIADFGTKRLLEALYSDDNLDEELTGGFLGNPNVGAVVLSGFKRSADFSLFTTAFSEGDRVFNVGSLFGGTGAAGLPWLLKELRKEKAGVGMASAIRRAAIGALMVLPYFKVQEDPKGKSRIDSSIFITKTKAALSYYYRHISGFNAVYYIADEALKAYENHESGQEQSNDAHLVELLGALAILEFARLPNNQLHPEGEPKYFEYAIDAADELLSFKTLGKSSSEMIAKPLTQLQMMALLDGNYFRHATGFDWAKKHGFTGTFFDSANYKDHVSTFLSTHYLSWIRQLGTNRRGFAPFREVTSLDDMSKMRVDMNANKPSLFKPRLSSERFTIAANLQSEHLGGGGTMARFLKLWWDVTNNVYDASYKKL